MFLKFLATSHSILAHGLPHVAVRQVASQYIVPTSSRQNFSVETRLAAPKSHLAQMRSSIFQCNEFLFICALHLPPSGSSVYRHAHAAELYQDILET